jgi:RimJ/RimL family protein N-acetyltransferase
MKLAVPTLENQLVKLEPATAKNVEILIEWTLDPVAQGPYKRVPGLNSDELRTLLLHSSDRQYFLIRRASDAHPLGRFYWRAWRFVEGTSTIDWELNIFVANPDEPGKGYGTATQRLAAYYLMTRPETSSIFAFTFAANHAEQRALLKAGFREGDALPNARYPVQLPNDPCVLFVRDRDV